MSDIAEVGQNIYNGIDSNNVVSTWDADELIDLTNDIAENMGMSESNITGRYVYYWDDGYIVDFYYESSNTSFELTVSYNDNYLNMLYNSYVQQYGDSDAYLYLSDHYMILYY